MANKPPINRILGNYEILNVLGQGTYGYVIKCFNQDTREIVAVKVLKGIHSQSSSKREVLILDKLRCLDPDKNSIIRCLGWFHRCDRAFMVFEKLDVSLFDYMCQRDWDPMPLNGLRIVIRDVATALVALKGLGLIHTDLKLDNILLVHHQKQPFRVKVIDFGLTLETLKARPLKNIQPLWFRSPEIILGISFTEAIDIWSVGVVMAVMVLGFPLLQGRHEYELLRLIVDLMGEPPRRLLNGAINTHLFCHGRRKYRMIMDWRVMTPTEFHAGTGIKPRVKREKECPSMDAMKTLGPHQEDSAGAADRNACVELLKEMLQVDPKSRITPNNVLAHPFIKRGDPGTVCPDGTLAAGSQAISDKDTAETRVDDSLQAVQGHSTNPPKAEGDRDHVLGPVNDITSGLVLESVSDSAKTSWSVVSDIVRIPSIAPNSCVEDPESILNHASNGINSLHPIDVGDPERKKKKKAIRGLFSTLMRSFCFCVSEVINQ